MVEQEDVNAILVGLFNANAKLTRSSSTFTARTMARKRKKISPELKAEWARGQRLLADRIAYHRRKLEQRRSAES